MPTLFDVLNTKHTALIGSDPLNDVVFNDTDTAAHHCQISKIADGKYLVVDLNSATGTFVNNKKIEKEFISETDFITVGSNIFQLTKKLGGNSAASAATPDFIIIPKEPPAPAPAFTEPVKEPARETFQQSFSAIPPASVKEIIAGKDKISVYFIAAPEDTVMCRAINKHLSTIRFNTSVPIEMDGDFKIEAGRDIAAYKEKLFKADIVLAFISVDFLNNDDCYDRIKRVIENHNNRKTILLPILARNCMWKATPFANLPLLPKNQQPLNNKQFWNSEDDALTEVVNDIYKSINEFTKNATAEKPFEHTVIAPALKVDWRKNYLWTVFWKRVAAYILDVFIIALPLMIGAIILLMILGVDVQYDESATILMYIPYVIAQVLVSAKMESSEWRGTPGKRIMKLQITDDKGNPIAFSKAVRRNVIKNFIFIFIGVHWFIAFIYYIAQTIGYATTKKFFHDQMSDTVIGER